MPLVPVYQDGRVRLVRIEGARSETGWQEEEVRRKAIARRRLYFDGEQYEDENFATADALGCVRKGERLPEHNRLHSYATQISESIEFIADQLAESFEIEVSDEEGDKAAREEALSVCQVAMAASDQLSGTNEDDDVSWNETITDALVAGDVAVEVRWDPVDRTAYLEFWEAETVRFDYADRRTLEAVTRDELIWVTDDDGEERQVLEQIRYDLVDIETPIGTLAECRRQIFWDQEEAPREVEMLGIPFIPWQILRADSASLRAVRGRSIISTQVMGHADRYNANEQVAYLIARFNSYASLAVTGDTVTLKLERDGGMRKDVADILTFPGGSTVSAVTLPTDPSMIEHQRTVLAEAMYHCFGLTRVDTETVANLGGISGYALEILNRKVEGTFRRIRRNWKRDIRTLLTMILDLTAYRMETKVFVADGAEFDPEATELPDGLLMAFWDVNPDETFPDRAFDIRMGSGYIVDDVLVRDDYAAGLISRQEALRQRGKTDDEISQIEKEIKDETPDPILPLNGLNGQASPADQNGSASKVKAGATVGTAERK